MELNNKKQGRDKRGRFTKGNQQRRKRIVCPYCNKELSVRVYPRVEKKVESDRLETEQTNDENPIQSS
jgi:uncharacterized protein with PIN domain